MKMANPPRVGILTLWTVLLLGSSKRFFDRATFNMVGIDENTMVNAIIAVNDRIKSVM